MDWTTWLIPLVGTLASTGATLFSAVSAARARASESESARLRELEQRLSSRKIETYEAILTAFGNMLAPEDSRPRPQAREGQQHDPLGIAVLEFMNHAIVYGSDEVLRAFSRFRLASSFNPPPPVLFRLTADFILAIRRDLDGDRSTVTGIEVLGIRVNDLYQQPALMRALTLPFEQVCKEEGWVAPWDSPSA